jgi:hypothetical protein
VFGRASGFDATLNFAALDGANGFRLDGIDRYDFSGWSVAGAGDISGDGFDDLVSGAPGDNASNVVFGRVSGFGARLDFASLDGANGFRLDGIARDDSGYSVAGAGDVNGDAGGGYAGASYVVFGRDSGFGASFDLATLDGTNGFSLDGIDEYDQSGRSVAGAGGRQRRRPGRSRHRRRHPRCIWQSFGIWCQRRSHYA